MESNTSILSGRRQLTVQPPSPRLVRSRSGGRASTITTPEPSSGRFSSSQRFFNDQRSKSTTKSRPRGNEENINPTITTISGVPRKHQEGRNGLVTFLQHGVSPNNNVGASKRPVSAGKSRSAWALSPGRHLSSPVGSESPAGKVKTAGGSSGSGVSKVLRYFKQKKVSSVQEEEYHRLRILHNRLLQWRFVNARAQVAMPTVKQVAEITLFSVWLNIIMMRKTILEKKVEIHRLRQRIKLYHIVNPQLSLLNEWPKLERRNQESVSRVARKLTALANTMPLINNTKADVETTYQGMTTATEVMQGIVEQLVRRHHKQVERILYQVTELATTAKQEEEYLQELLKTIPMISSLLVCTATFQVYFSNILYSFK
ncbi:hypothetical protein L6164_017567 [Bauhinia variegata]|uniref:Uncharacterized protein n=1 Tax=Bauhinia variegata TaxID=167791 RepID=A0ACB9N8I1_BAUVA|nr:hypothetical protein L6164_017567 [Bauhinia variegata]